VNPGGGSGWDEPPLDIQVPDDARELERDVLAYHRELRAQRRRKRLRRLTAPFGQGTVLPLLASILAVCLVAGAMLSVATFSPATGSHSHTNPPTATASSTRSVSSASSPAAAANAGPSGHTAAPSPSGPSPSGSASPSLSSAQATRSGPTHAAIPGGP
jgi:hypothetical protein